MTFRSLKNLVSMVWTKNSVEVIKSLIRFIVRPCGILTVTDYDNLQILLMQLSKQIIQKENDVNAALKITNTDNHSEAMQQFSESTRWLAENHARLRATKTFSRMTTASALVSIIMPTWNRAKIIKNAIESVIAQTYPHWELLIIDDGSTDDTEKVLAEFKWDNRIKYIRQTHRGVSAARNIGLANSRGEIIAYLDTDNTWFAHYLATIIQAFETLPEYNHIYLPELVLDLYTRDVYIRCENFNIKRLRAGNYIDLNIYAHRRDLYTRYGGFDEQLTRLVDWDLVLRYAENTAPLLINELGGLYLRGEWDRISTSQKKFYNIYLVRRKYDKPLNFSLHVLYVLHSHTLLNPIDDALLTEIEYMQRLGVKISIWSENEKLPVTFPSTVQINFGSLNHVIKNIVPDIVHEYEFKLAFNLDLYNPSQEKDSGLILYRATNLANNDQKILTELFEKCSQYRFEKISKNLSRNQIASLLRKASIYIVLDQQALAEEISLFIIEAFACGCYVIAKNFESIKGYLDNGYAIYKSTQDIISLIKATESWTDKQWIKTRIAITDHAYQYYVDRIALRPLLEAWMDIAQEQQEPASAGASYINS